MTIATVAIVETATVDIAQTRILAMRIHVKIVGIGGRLYDCRKAKRWADRREMMSTVFYEF
jgi:hypothetical protein